MRGFRGILALTPVLLLSGCGGGGDDGVEEVRVTMREFAYEPERTTFEAGTPYRFVLVNQGIQEHDWVVLPEGVRDESQALVKVEESELPPGATVEQDFTFPEPGSYDFVCFVAGHLQSGMVLTVTVE
ncbi:MAG: cupredoxin domain-containing protein [Longimicrobiaceae bacterium]